MASKGRQKALESVAGVVVLDGVPLVKLADIRPFEQNPREHPEEQVRALTAWIMEVGFIVPVLLDKDNGLIEGHGRVLAAKAIGMDRIPALHASHLTKKQVRAHVIAGNKIATMATWNPETLTSLLDEVKADFDTRLLGFSDADLRRLSDDVDRALLRAQAIEPDPDERAVARGEEPEHREDEGAGGGSDPEQVPFSVILSPDERAEVYAAIRKVKDRDGVSLTSNALLTIIREWNR